MNKNIKVTHLSSAHQRYDIRIFLKECTSLANSGYIVSLVVADGEGDEEKNGVNIYDVGPSKGRIDRIFRAPGRVLKKAIDLDSDIYHLHDPELIPIGLKLKNLGKKVIFDSHEDVPKQILGKPYLNKYTKFPISLAFSFYERYAIPKLDAVVAATSSISSKYAVMRVRTININNYPLIDELSSDDINWSNKEKQLAYVGGISQIRGILQVVQAMGRVESGARLQLAGEFNELAIEEEAHADRGWHQVDALGLISRKEVRDLLADCIGGLVTFLPSPNHIDAQPNKMFEYMSAGVPVIASNFQLWKEIINGNNCGVCVDPLDPNAIAEAINYLVDHPLEAEEMGRNGQKAVQRKYNWSVEEKKLTRFYDSL